MTKKKGNNQGSGGPSKKGGRSIVEERSRNQQRGEKIYNVTDTLSPPPKPGSKPKDK